MFPKFQCVPNSSSFYPISCALSCILVTYINNPKEHITTYVFWTCSKLDDYFSFMGQPKMPITKEKKLNFEGPHSPHPPQLINMSHNILVPSIIIFCNGP